jgi:hypothetical protein
MADAVARLAQNRAEQQFDRFASLQHPVPDCPRQGFEQAIGN